LSRDHTATDDLVQSSAEALDPHLDGFAAAFYARLFAQHPGVRQMFHVDPGVQFARLATELRRIVSALRDPDRFVRQVRTLGRRHHGYGVVPAHYDVVGAVLVETFEDQLGAAFTADLRAAWTVAYAHIAAQMVAAGAEPVPA
jgi:hemoglobin-like flavoprotein